MPKLIPDPVGSPRELEHFFECENCLATWKLVYRYNERTEPKMSLPDLSQKWSTLPEKKRESLRKQLVSNERAWFKSLGVKKKINYLHLFSQSLRMSVLPGKDTKLAWDALPQDEKQVFIDESKRLRTQQKLTIKHLKPCLRAQYRIMKKPSKRRKVCNAFNLYLGSEWMKAQFLQPTPTYKQVMLCAATSWKLLKEEEKRPFQEQAAENVQKLVGFQVT